MGTSQCLKDHRQSGMKISGFSFYKGQFARKSSTLNLRSNGGIHETREMKPDSLKRSIMNIHLEGRLKKKVILQKTHYLQFL